MRPITVICGVSAALVMLAGCHSYDIVQANIFSDDEGNVVSIGYGRSTSVHENTFTNPATGEELSFKSKLVIEAELPDGQKLTAWQCMNFLPSGTMYMTDNEKWKVLLNGFNCFVYQRLEERPGEYAVVYRGLLCDSPKLDYKKNTKWRKMKKNSKGQWR